MKKLFTRIFLLIILLVPIIMGGSMHAYAVSFTPSVNTQSSILMSGDGSTVLFENNADEQRPVASIVKMMTIYISLQEIEKGNLHIDDKVVVSEKASNMGGSQIFLDANSTHNAGQLLKSVIISSANDSSLALAEHIAGSESAFVSRMNTTAKELNMTNTNYVNTNGLPAPSQYSSARDVGILMSHLSKFDLYKQYAKIWLEDYVHPTGRTTVMSNTNRLLRSYKGVECGKTGSTVEAGYCLAVSVVQNDMPLIAVVLKADSGKERFAYASELLDYGFANYTSTKVLTDEMVTGIKVSIPLSERKVSVKLRHAYTVTEEKNTASKYSVEYVLPEMVRQAKANEVIGYAKVLKGNEEVAKVELLATENVKAPTYFENISGLLKRI